MTLVENEDKQKSVTRYNVTGDGLRARSLLRNDNKQRVSSSIRRMFTARRLKTRPSFYLLLLDLDRDLVRSPHGAFDALLQRWRGVLHPLLQQVLTHIFNGSFVNVGWKIQNQASPLARVPAARPPPAPAFS